jgi:hypothetical protein
MFNGSMIFFQAPKTDLREKISVNRRLRILFNSLKILFRVRSFKQNRLVIIAEVLVIPDNE